MIGNVEKLYTALRDNFKELSSVPLDNVFTFEYDNNKYVLAFSNGNPFVIVYTYVSGNYNFTKLNLSEQYSVFGKNTSTKPLFRSNLPIAYK